MQTVRIALRSDLCISRIILSEQKLNIINRFAVKTLLNISLHAENHKYQYQRDEHNIDNVFVSFYYKVYTVGSFRVITAQSKCDILNR
jgi:hypothetical protein